MEISRTAAAALIGGCLAIGAGAAYVGSRPSGQPDTALEAGAGLPTADSAAAAGVEQSETLIEPASVAPATPELRPAAPAPQTLPRTETRSRRAAAAPAPGPGQTTLPADESRMAIPPQLSAAPRVDAEPAREPEPAAQAFEELVVSADSVLGLEVETAITSERARVEDPVTARVTRDVRVGDRVAIPAGAKVNGEVTVVEPGGRLRDRARLGIRFTSIVLADGTRLPLQSETVYREGSGPGGESAAKIGGGAIGGAIIGGILGGAKGAAIGGSVGAGAGSAAVLAGGRNPATLPAGTPVTVRIEQPVTVTVEK